MARATLDILGWFLNLGFDKAGPEKDSPAKPRPRRVPGAGSEPACTEPKAEVFDMQKAHEVIHS